MRVHFLKLCGACTILLASFAGYSAVAQSPPQPSVVKVPDGGTSGKMESIFIPPKADAPFSLTLVTEWSRPMPSGGSFTLANQRHIARDTQGRIYQERWILVPKGGKIQSRMDTIQITDPHQHTWYNCNVEHKICELFQYSLTTTQTYAPATAPAGPLRNSDGFRTNEDLGTSSVEGLETHGYRETVTINAGSMGNDQPMINTREFWYSPQLAINLDSMVETAQTGKQVFTVKDLSTSEPEPALFEIPEGYTTVDRRSQD